jgi:hypothetical protein
VRGMWPTVLGLPESRVGPAGSKASGSNSVDEIFFFGTLYERSFYVLRPCTKSSSAVTFFSDDFGFLQPPCPWCPGVGGSHSRACAPGSTQPHWWSPRQGSESGRFLWWKSRKSPFYSSVPLRVPGGAVRIAGPAHRGPPRHVPGWSRQGRSRVDFYGGKHVFATCVADSHLVRGKWRCAVPCVHPVGARGMSVVSPSGPRVGSKNVFPI